MKHLTGPVCDLHKVPKIFLSWRDKREHDRQFHRAKFLARLQQEKEMKRRQEGARESDIWQEYYGGMQQ